MRDDLETRVAMLERTLAEVQKENERLRKLIVIPKWEYQWINIPAGVGAWDKAGANGWELVCIVAASPSSQAFFKRRIS